MCKLILTAGLCLIFASLASSLRLVCLYNSKSRKTLQEGKFKVSDINATYCTHLVFGAAKINSDFELEPIFNGDEERYEALKKLKMSNSKLKTLLDGKLNVKRFARLASADNRAIFIQSAISLLRDNDFDGLNLNWQFGEKSGQDGKNTFMLLCKGLKEAFDAEATSSGQPRLLLTASVSAEKGVIDDSYTVKKLSRYLDFMNVLTFDLHRPDDGVTKHHSPLYQGSTDTGDAVYYNTDAAMKYWQSKGAPAEKLNLGVATFGRSFTLSNSTDNGVGAAANGPGESGCFTDVPGMWAYYEICIYMKGEQNRTIAGQKVPFATAEDQWVGYDDMDSIDEKVNYLKENNFGGVFFSSLDQDDFNGEFCGEGEYPLLRYVDEALRKDPGADP